MEIREGFLHLGIPERTLTSFELNQSQKNDFKVEKFQFLPFSPGNTKVEKEYQIKYPLIEDRGFPQLEKFSFQVHF